MTNIPMRNLGRSWIEVSPIGMGCWAIGGNWKLGELPAGWGEVDDAESIRAIHAALAHGINFSIQLPITAPGIASECLARRFRVVAARW
jgi:predicted aldo/keto reductase-like oxidoreductase